ncbi:MAG: hypothetical protein LUG50_07125 [Planctomycetaceae bacterium]|nr:hypothetical protein [Planctomycetaceae bacterium]
MWDYETIFSDNQKLETENTTSGNILDVGPKDIAPGEPVVLQISLDRGGDSALTVTVESAGDAAMSDAVDRVVYLVDAERVRAGGVVLAAPLPSGCGRFLRLKYTGGVGATVVAGLVQAAQTSGMRR